MGEFLTVAIIIIIVITIILFISGFKIVPQSEAYVIERLGCYYTTWNEGLYFLLPFISKIAKKVLLKEQFIDFRPQEVITRDNITLQINTLVYFQIIDPKLYTYGVNNPIVAIENLTVTTLRNIVGDLELDETLKSNNIINTKLYTILDEATNLWGIKINRVEIKNNNV